MPLDVGLWRVDGGFSRLEASGMPTERRLEDLIEADPSVLGTPLLILGRQVATPHGKFVDLLAIDGDGALHVLELKRDRTPRDVVAQTLDYGSWVQTLSHDDVREVYEKYRGPEQAFEEAFEETFGVAPPDELNVEQTLTIVAAELDSESERIVDFLAGTFGVPINAVFFRYFRDGDREYVARTWLREQASDPVAKAGGGRKLKESWNGKDWYISFGDEETRDWEDAREHGFVAAGGGEWYSRSLRSVPVGAWIWVCIPKTGYVGVGEVAGDAEPFTGSRFAGQRLRASYSHANGEDEWVLPVNWLQTRSRSEAVWQKGMFANQNSATRLRSSFTLDVLHRAFPAASD
ncbi:MAG: hypothetical protein GC157_09935 [Frankiales bacterium]|nr:hypothetical protein [Frankiales bacterium]